MKVLLLTMGSRGDVQPFVALARGLLAAGHEPVVAGPRRFGVLAEPYGIAFEPLADEMLDLQDQVKGQGAGAAITAARSVKPMVRQVLDEEAALVVPGLDVIVYHPKALGGPYLAEKAGVPSAAGLLLPLYVPTAAFASPILPVRLPPAVNRATWRVAAAVEAPYRSVVRTWRSEVLGLCEGFRPAAELIAAGPVLHAWSPRLLPAPADWPPGADPIGFWTLPASGDWSPPEALAAFLAEGPPPLYAGFGSMVGRDPRGLAATVVEAARLAGLRTILATGWGGLRPGDEAGDVLVIEEAPHDRLLPRVAVALHHGGIGTVAAALRAGVPQVVRPFLGDQPFWADRLNRLGVAPPPLRARPRAQEVAAALEAALSMASTAAAVAAEVATEDGVAEAISRLETLTAR
ncbi:glycosyltransferase [Nonomuraea sp. NPDC050790]|uniref:glycosyltransferase n=1 Tax=Nonomuraea sp. NPDC050790 TaxID=3364371 RepID=UPI0037A6270D